MVGIGRTICLKMSISPDGLSNPELAAGAVDLGVDASVAESIRECSSAWWDAEAGTDLLLAIDSSSRTGSLAVLRGQFVLAEASWTATGPGGALHLGFAELLLQNHGYRLADLRAIAVAVGPGSFTGIRAGLSLGQGLASALDVPIVGVSTLEALAWQLGSTSRPGDLICAVVGAGRGLVHLGMSEVVGSGSFVHRSPATVTADELCVSVAATPNQCVVVGGEIEQDLACQLMKSRPGVTIANPVTGQRRAAYVGMSGLVSLRSRVGTENPLPETVQPVYLNRENPVRGSMSGWSGER
ncbi:MAG: tRNA (adenosine(37)-N6)-threonylcarbamoyltransferase complex dimerization subunit type 1 TsaB [Chloroflexi bacterium]|nr:tRNA (adenosine(37)-N6)-threonylcarbamoyltransferase complex dimerization subunit type 1 TsaB [Chloroflexota bacterium]